MPRSPYWLAILLALSPTAFAAPPSRPLVVELFTSQGCSSCPPADTYLTELATRPDLLALTFHVTYWDNLGWVDPFSLAAATDRQRHYASLSGDSEIYTPEMVIDGRQGVVGSDRHAVAAALRQDASEATAAVPVQLTRNAAGIAIDVGAGAGNGTVYLIGFDPQRRTAIARGENGGRTLLESNIVRAIAPAGSWTGQPARFEHPAPAGQAVAVIVQAEDGRILGAAQLKAGG